MLMVNSGATIFYYKTGKSSLDIITKLNEIKETSTSDNCKLIDHNIQKNRITGKCTYTHHPHDQTIIPSEIEYIIYPEFQKIIIIISKNQYAKRIAEILISSIEYTPNADDYFDKLKINKDKMYSIYKALKKSESTTFIKTAIFYFEDESLVDIKKKYKEENYGKLEFTLAKNRSAELHNKFKELFSDATKFQMHVGIKSLPGIFNANHAGSPNILQSTYEGRFSIVRDIDVQGWVKFFEHYLPDVLKQH